jgi:CubicO group peptidase (beta-lactamase class C family)
VATDWTAELDDLVASTLEGLPLPGAAVGVSFDGREHVACAGVTSLNAPVPVDGDTLFLIGSTTKTVTATAVQSYAAEGVLDLDAPVAQWLDRSLRVGAADLGEQVTLRHLLSHSAGFVGDLDSVDGWGDDAIARSLEAVAAAAQLHAPGAGSSYSNAGIRLAGRILELVTGKPYEQVVRERVLDPLAMATSFFFPWEVATRRHAVGHLVRDGEARWSPSYGISRGSAPEGALASTVRDQLHYARFHLDGTVPDGCRAPLPDDARLAMQTPQAPGMPPLSAVGLSWLLRDRAGTQLLTHGGNVSFLQLSDFVLVPDAGLAVTVLTNSAAGKPFGQTVLDWCLSTLAGLPAPPAPESRTAADLGEYSGRYEAGQWDLDVQPRDGGLRVAMLIHEHLLEEAGMDNPPASEVVFVGEELVADAARPDSPTGRFHRGDGGAVTALTYGLRHCPRRP